MYDNDKIINLYFDNGMSLSEISAEIGCSSSYIRKMFKMRGLKCRKLSDACRKWRKTDNIKDDHIIDLMESGMSCISISKKFGKSREFARQRLMAIGVDRRSNSHFNKKRSGEKNHKWNGGITDIRKTIRESKRYYKWMDDIYKNDNFQSIISGSKRDINCHHIIPFRYILQSSMTKHNMLPEDIKRLCVINDDRFFDVDNGITLSKQEHAILEKTPQDAHPLWRLATAFPNSRFIENIDTSLFNITGKIDFWRHEIKICCGINDDIRKLIRYQHYIGTIPPHSLVLSAYIGNVIIGCAIFGEGANKNIGQHTWELLRLCIPYWVSRKDVGYHSNGYASKFLSQCVKYINRNHSNIKKIIAFSDSSAGHDGIVYRASSWDICGSIAPDYCYFDPSRNCILHKSRCRRIKGINKTEKQLASERGWIKIKTQKKTKYIKNLN